MNGNCVERVLSEEYTDYIFEYNSEQQEVAQDYMRFCAQFASDRYVCIYVDPRISPELSVEEYSYTAIPKLYGLMDSTAADATGAIRLQNITGFGLTGRGVIVGFVDTGIDYTNMAFRNTTGQTRIVSIWDQTDQSGNPPEGFIYGTEYTKADIDRALQSDNPQSVVPHKDENGHGTFLAGVACGSNDTENDFIGTAPDCQIAMVKLKKAKQYLRDFYFVDNTDDVYQENDIMLGVRYLQNVAQRENKPLVVVIGLGTSLGDHSGGAPLPQMLDDVGSTPGYCVVVCGGNEGNAKLHYLGKMESEMPYQDVEIRVGENESGFTMELWGQTPDVFSVAIISPFGETVPRIPARVGLSEVHTFLLEESRVFVDYRIVESGSGAELIFMRFEKPTPGIWTVRVFGSNILDGTFHMWLPIKEFIGTETYFLEPEPDYTITEPGNAQNVITMSAYNNVTGAFYINSGRGYTRTNVIKPDMTAPGVDVFGPALSIGGNRNYTRKSGTSIAAALTAGVCAQFLEWGIVRGNEPYMKTVYIKNYLIRGAERDAGTAYPNRQTGYGKINGFDAFGLLTTT